MSKAGYAAILLLIAAAGCVALTMLFPRFDPSSRWGLTLDRSQSIGRARDITRHYGVNSDGWDATVSAAEIRGVSQYLASGAGKEVGDLLVPLRITVQLFDRKSDDRAVVQLGPQGQFEGYSHRQHAITRQSHYAWRRSTTGSRSSSCGPDRSGSWQVQSDLSDSTGKG